jgi:hypothetical protein
MPHKDAQELLNTKLGLILGAATAGLTLADIDLIMAIILKGVSIISFTIVIVLNFGKLINKVKEWFK